MSNTTSVIDETTVSDDSVIVTRRLARKDDKILGTIEVQPTGQSPVVLAHIVDEFPADLPIDAVRFKPDQAPEMGDVTPQRASIKETVETESVRIKYGIELSEPVETIEFDPPTIRDVETAEMTRSATTHTDGGERSSASADGADESSSSIASLLPSFGREPVGVERPEGHQSPDATPEDPAIEPSGTDGPSGDGLRDGTVESAIERVSEPGDGETEVSEATGATEVSETAEATEVSETAEVTGTAETVETESDPVEGRPAGRDPATADGRETAVGSAAHDSDPPAEAETTAGESGRETGQGDRRSVEVRIDQLSARVEEFAAYASALEELIDEHGTAPEFIDRTQRELTDLDARVRSVREAVSAVEDAHDEDVSDLREQTDALDGRIDDARQALETDIDDVRERVGDVGAEVERIDTGLADQGSAIGTIEGDLEALDDRVTGVEDDIEAVRETVESVEDDVAAVSEDVSEMREELRSLRDAVDDLNEFRDSLAYAFDAPADTTAQADD